MVCCQFQSKRRKNFFCCCCKEDFGFEHRLWIYSGRRGVHCWVCDQTARELQSSIRQAIVEHITVITVRGKSFSQCWNSSCFRVEKIRQSV
jgi:DNA primase catalytic subunit